jgi:hypothetical protein
MADRQQKMQDSFEAAEAKKRAEARFNKKADDAEQAQTAWAAHAAGATAVEAKSARLRELRLARDAAESAAATAPKKGPRRSSGPPDKA